MNGTNLTLIFEHPVLISSELIWQRLFHWYLIQYLAFLNPLGLKLITRLQLGLSHLNEHRFKHNFNDYINPLCTCSPYIESTVRYFLHCNYYNSTTISLLKWSKLMFFSMVVLSLMTLKMHVFWIQALNIY